MVFQCWFTRRLKHWKFGLVKTFHQRLCFSSSKFLVTNEKWKFLLIICLELPLAFFLGAIVGSFLNVCATRIPKGLSIVSPRSTCPGCNKKINWFNNLPVISWLLLQSRASCCEFKIPFRYFLVELFTALVFGFMFLELDDFRNWGLLLSGMFSFHF